MLRQIRPPPEANLPEHVEFFIPGHFDEPGPSSRIHPDRSRSQRRSHNCTAHDRGSHTAESRCPPPVAALPTDPPAAVSTLPPALGIADREAAFLRAMRMLKSASATERSNALQQIQASAEAGLPAAQHNLGVFYLHGTGVASNQAAATRWLRQSAEQGFAEAQFKLSALLVSQGEAPLEEAAGWLEKASAQGHAEAAYQLGVIRLRGIRNQPDPAGAARAFRVAADRGHVKSQVNLGVLLFHGGAGETNRNEALTWYRRAADQGHPGARFNLGTALAKGDGIDQDLVSAYFWLSLAAQQGDQDAEAAVKETVATMTPAQLAEGVRRVSAYRRSTRAEAPSSPSNPP